jgi:hypothetical protein
MSAIRVVPRGSQPDSCRAGGFVDCGPALFNRPDPLPDPTCASAYFPLPAVSVVFIVVGIVGAILCVGLLARTATLIARST